MTLEIYKLSIFFICISIGIQFVEVSGIIPNTHTGYADKYANAGIIGNLQNLVSYMFGNTVPESFTYLGISLATFGFLIFTLPFMLALFGYGYFIGLDFISKFIPFSIAPELNIGLSTLLTIIYIVGYMQYKANVSLKSF